MQLPGAVYMCTNHVNLLRTGGAIGCRTHRVSNHPVVYTEASAAVSIVNAALQCSQIVSWGIYSIIGAVV